MRKKNFKGKCEKRIFSKCKSVCKTYDPVQSAYAGVLENNPEVIEFRCNEELVDLEIGAYTTDFVCVKSTGELMVRECLYHKLISRPQTAKLLDASRNYWLKRGVKDWGIVVDEADEE